MRGYLFVDFEASSLTSESWPIEVGVAQIVERQVIVESRLIRPHETWDPEDWHPESAAVHGISRAELAAADPAEEVARWLVRRMGSSVLVSDAPEYDRKWLIRLLEVIGQGASAPEILDFDQLAWALFSHSSDVAPGRLHVVMKRFASRRSVHRAGPDAADMAYAFRKGLGR